MNFLKLTLDGGDQTGRKIKHLILTIVILFLFVTKIVACECIPEITSAVVDESGTMLTLVFNKSMTLTGKGDGWLSRLDATYAVQYATGDGTDTWVFDIVGPVRSTDELTLGLNQTPVDSLGYLQLPFTDFVENDSTQ